MGFLYNGSKKRLYFIQFLLIVAVTYLIYCFLPKERGAVLPNYEEKKPWSGTAVIADQSFPILRSEEDVRADSLSILEEFKPYYNLNENTADKVSADIATAIEKSQKPELLALIDPLKRRLHALYSKGVISDDEKAKVTGGTEISVIETKGKTKTVLTTDINDLWVLSHLYNQLFMDEHIKQQQEALKALGIEEYLVPNLERDEEKCETELKDMFATIARYAGDVAKGEKIIDHGQIVDETSYLKLKSFEEKLKGEYKQESDWRFRRDVIDYLVKKADLTLPEEFLKKWLFRVNDGKFTMEQIEKEFPLFLQDYRWQMISRKIFEDQKMKIDKDDLLKVAKDMTVSQFAMYGMPNVPEDYINRYAEQMLNDQKEINRIYEKCEEEKVLDYVKGVITADVKETTRAQMAKLNETASQEKPAKKAPAKKASTKKAAKEESAEEPKAEKPARKRAPKAKAE